MQFSRILVPVDISKEPTRALRYAEDLADICKATLVYLVIDKNSGRDTSGRISAEEMPPAVKRYFYEHTHKTVQVEYRLSANNDVADEILERLEHDAIDLIIIQSIKPRKPSWTLLDSLSQELIRTSHCPVLSIRNQGDASTKRILAPVDFSEANKAALAYAGSMAQTMHASLDLLHVVEDILMPGFYVEMANPMMLDFSEEFQEHVKKGMNELLKLIPDDVETHYQVLHGHAASVILDYAAENKVDMIVIGSHGLTAIERFFLGSVADRILQLAECPVLLIPSKSNNSNQN